MKLLIWAICIALAVTLIVVVGGYLYLKSTVSKYDGELKVKGLNAPVEILRDSYGVPHIFAENDHDAFFALGYCMAQDRLFQMEMVKYIAQGKLSEIMGPSTIWSDKYARFIQSTIDSKVALGSQRPETLAALNAYLGGVNFHIENRREPLPFEFTALGFKPKKWKPEEMSAVIVFGSWDFGGGRIWKDLLRGAITEKVGEEMAQQILVGHSAGYPTAIPEGESYYPGFQESSSSESDLGFNQSQKNEMPGSIHKLLSATDYFESILQPLGLASTGEACNSFVISSDLSETGKPILGHDCHNPFAVPSLWYEAHLVTPDMNVSGYTRPCSFTFAGGQNEHLAWVFTDGADDSADVYIEKIDPDNPNRYLYKGEWHEMQIRKEIIKVKGSENVEFILRSTHHGPVLNDIFTEEHEDLIAGKPDSTVFSVRWAAPDLVQNVAITQFISKAKSVDEFIELMEMINVPAINWVFADTNGDIGFFYGSGIPIRKGFDGSIPVPGWTGEYEWEGYVPASELPQAKNPNMGFFNTSNSKPASDDYPYSLGKNFSPPDRLTRVRQIIKETVEEKGKFGIEDSQKIFKDVYVAMASEMVPHILSSLEGRTLSDQEKKAVGRLSSWNYMAEKDEVAPAIFRATYLKIVENTFSERLGDDLYKRFAREERMTSLALRNLLTQKDSSWFDNPKTREIESRDTAFSKSFKEGVSYLEEKLGSNVDGWLLGNAQTLTLRHPFAEKAAFLSPLLNIGPYPVSGGLNTPYPGGYSRSNPFETTDGSNERFVIDLSDRRNSKIIYMPGLSENFMSPHYDDQADMWYEFKFRPFMLYRDQVEQDAKYVMKMTPE